MPKNKDKTITFTSLQTKSYFVFCLDKIEFIFEKDYHNDLYQIFLNLSSGKRFCIIHDNEDLACQIRDALDEAVEFVEHFDVNSIFEVTSHENHI